MRSVFRLYYRKMDNFIPRIKESASSAVTPPAPLAPEERGIPSPRHPPRRRQPRPISCLPTPGSVRSLLPLTQPHRPAVLPAGRAASFPSSRENVGTVGPCQCPPGRAASLVPLPSSALSLERPPGSGPEMLCRRWPPPLCRPARLSCARRTPRG